jgi:hypothetical protein
VSAFKWAVAIALGVLFYSSPLSACASDPHDAVAETHLIKEAFAGVKADDPRRQELDHLLPRIDVSLGNLGPQGIYQHAGLRSRALELLNLERIPRWPAREADALQSAPDVAKDPDRDAKLKAAQTAWSQKRYAEAKKILEDALKARNIKVQYLRC